jgi:hypothetical protein
LPHLHSLRNVTVSGFSGKGFDLSASATDPGDGNSEYGNLSNSTLDECAAISNGSHGLHIRGIDANTCSTKNFTAQLNGGWGILNESFIGNEHDKPNLATNTLGAIKAVNAAKNLFSNPNIETGTGNNIELSGTNVVARPCQWLFRAHSTRHLWRDARRFRSNRRHNATNSSGTASAYVPHGTTNLTIVGNGGGQPLRHQYRRQTITLTGNVTGTGTGSFATTIAPAW